MELICADLNKEMYSDLISNERIRSALGEACFSENINKHVIKRLITFTKQLEVGRFHAKTDRKMFTISAYSYSDNITIRFTVDIEDEKASEMMFNIDTIVKAYRYTCVGNKDRLSIGLGNKIVNGARAIIFKCGNRVAIVAPVFMLDSALYNMPVEGEKVR